MHGNTWFGSHFCRFGGTSPGARPRKNIFPYHLLLSIPQGLRYGTENNIFLPKECFGSITGISENRAEIFLSKYISFQMFLNQEFLSIPGYSLKIGILFKPDCIDHLVFIYLVFSPGFHTRIWAENPAGI